MNTFYSLYLDESGDTRKHDVPLKNGQTNSFTLSGVVMPVNSWKNIDRKLLKLKLQYFEAEIARSTKDKHRWEKKGNVLFNKTNDSSGRTQAFIQQIFKLIKKNGFIIGVTITKNHKNPVPSNAIYGMALQKIAELYNNFLADKKSYGNIIIDSRSAHSMQGKGLDYEIASSYLSYIFGNDRGKSIKRIIEAPLFADSSITAGIQIADLVSACLNNYAMAENIGVPKGSAFTDYSHIFRHKKNIFENIYKHKIGTRYYKCWNVRKYHQTVDLNIASTKSYNKDTSILVALQKATPNKSKK